MKNGPIDKILRIQLGLYIRKPGKFNLAHENLILMRGIAVENLKTPIMGSKIKVVVNFIYGYQNLSIFFNFFSWLSYVQTQLDPKYFVDWTIFHFGAPPY